MSSGTALSRIRATLPSLQPSDARVAQVLIDDPASAIRRSVSEIADAADTSTATVVRAAQKLGFKGFHDLKLALAAEQSSFVSPEETGDVLDSVAAAGARTVMDAASLVDRASFAAAVEHIASAPRVLFAGVGTSAPLAQDAAYRLVAIGVPASSSPDAHVQHVLAGSLTPSDALVAVSHTGSTSETLRVVEAARDAGAKTIAITSYLRSPLTEIVDLTLTAGSREVSFRLEAMASRLAHMVVLDALMVAIADRDPRRAKTALDRYAAAIVAHRL